MSPQLSNALAMINRLKEHNIYFMNQGKNQNGADCLYVYARTERQEEVVIVEVSIDMGQVILAAKARQPHLIALALQSVSFIITASI